LTANILEATSKNIEEQSNILISSLAAYIMKKTLAVTMKIEAIGVIYDAVLNNGMLNGPRKKYKSIMLFAAIAITPNTIQKIPEYLKCFPKFCLFLIPKNRNKAPKVISEIIFGIISNNA